MEQESTYVIRKIAFEYNDATYDFVVEGGIEACYHTYDNAYAAFSKLEEDTRREVYRPDYYPQVFHTDGTVNEAWDREGHGIIISDSGTDEEAGDIRRIHSGQFYTISVFDTTPYFYVIVTNLSHYKEEKIVTLDGIPLMFPSHEAATHHLGDCLMDFSLKGTPEELSDMPALLQQLVNSHPYIFEERKPGEIFVNIWSDNIVINEVLKILFELLKEKPVTIRKVNIDHPSLWSKKRHM